MTTELQLKIDDYRGLLHDVKNQVMVLEAALALVEDRLRRKSMDEASELLRVSKVSIDRIKRIIRSGGEAKCAVDVRQVLSEVVEIYRDPKTVVSTSFDDEEVSVWGKYSDLLRVLQNLVKNACEAMHESDSKVLRLTAHNVGSDVVIKVFNTGSVLPTCTDGRQGFAHVFQMGTSTKPDGEGVGLSVVKRLTELNDGSVSAYNLPGGVEFTLVFPVKKEEP